MQNLVSKNPIQRFKIQYYQGGTPKGGINLGIKSKKEIESNNNKERNLASHHFSKVFSDNEGIWDGIKHLARGIQHGYNGYLDPETQYQTGAPTILPGRTPTKVPSVRKVGKMLKNRLFQRGYNKSDVRITQVPYNQVPEGERITMFKNADGSRTPRYYDKKYGHWIDVEYPSSIMSPKVNKSVPKITRSTPKVQNLSNDAEVSIIENSYIPEYDYNNDVQIINSAWDDAYNYYNPDVIVDLLKKGGQLVSRNPIQRFKQGNKIKKFANPDGPIEKKSYKSNYNKNYVGGGQKIMNWFSNLFNSPQQITRVGMNGKPIVDTMQKNSSQTVQQQDTPVTGKMVSDDSPLSNINRAIDNYVDGMNQRKKLGDFGLKPGYPSGFRAGYNDYGNSQSSTSKQTVTKSVISKPVNNYYLKGFENRKAELAQQGKTVRDIQKMLGFTGKDLDGKWGQNTEDAYNVWLNQQKTNQEVPVVEKPADIVAADTAYDKSKDNAVYSFSGKTLPTPDYGYYSPSNYGTLNPRWLKTAGATNIEGFRNLVNNNNQLKQDLLNRYGENWEQHLFNAAGVNANKRHFGRKSRRLINEALQNTVDTLNNNYMDKVRAYDQQYGLYKQGGQLVSRNPITRFKNRK